MLNTGSYFYSLGKIYISRCCIRCHARSCKMDRERYRIRDAGGSHRRDRYLPSYRPDGIYLGISDLTAYRGRRDAVPREGSRRLWVLSCGAVLSRTPAGSLCSLSPQIERSSGVYSPLFAPFAISREVISARTPPPMAIPGPNPYDDTPMVQRMGRT